MSKLVEKIRNAGGFWFFLCAGILMLLFGAWVISNEKIAFAGLSTVIVVEFLLSGLADAVTVIRYRRFIPRWVIALFFPMFIVIDAIIILTMRDGASRFMIFMYSFGFMLQGVSILFVGLQETRYSELSNRATSFIIGVAVILLGVFIMANPELAIKCVSWLIGIAFVSIGSGLIFTGIKCRIIEKRLVKNGQ
ncbi:MAG: DUF308 domain-containing protein [Sphaerochaetaceae bacterium]|nr:DUF308 domain-containing protein [Sphaerochaetaceae bacterium]